MRYVALIQKRGDYGNRHFVKSDYGEAKERFIERIKNCYIKPYISTETPHYWEVEFYSIESID